MAGQTLARLTVVGTRCSARGPLTAVQGSGRLPAAGSHLGHQNLSLHTCQGPCAPSDPLSPARDQDKGQSQVLGCGVSASSARRTSPTNKWFADALFGSLVFGEMEGREQD